MLTKDMDCMEQHSYPLFLSVYIRNVHHHHHTHHFHENCKENHIDGMLWLEGEVPVDAVVAEKPSCEISVALMQAY